PELVGAADNVEVLNGAVDYAGTQWSSSLSNVIQSPCYQIIVKEFYGGEPLASTTLNEVVTHLPPSGNLFHTEYDKKGKDGQPCPIVPLRPNLKETLCPALYDALYKHEEVHQQQCRELWKRGGQAAAEKFFKDTNSFAANEIRAYDVQIELMKQSMDKLIQRKGCQVSQYSIKDFAPKPNPDVDTQKALNWGRALKLISDNNKKHPKKGGGK